MGQDDILGILRKNRRTWFSYDTLKPLVPLSDPSLRRSICNVVKWSKAYNVRFKRNKYGKYFIKAKK